MPLWRDPKTTYAIMADKGYISNCRMNLCVLDCFVPRNDGDTYRHCEERSNPEKKKTTIWNAPQTSRRLHFLKENATFAGIKTGIVQKEGIIKNLSDKSGNFYFDPLQINTFEDLTANMFKKVAVQIRKKGLENYLAKNEHEVFAYETVSGIKTFIWAIRGSDYSATEFQIAEKLAKSGQHVLFPKLKDLGKGRKNDVYLYDSKTYVQQKVELKALFGNSAETVKKQLISGTGQANIIAYDIQSNIKIHWLINGLRSGWGDDTKKVLLNWKGQWYQLDREHAFKKGWLEGNLK